jgi:hypothetical protein
MLTLSSLAESLSIFTEDRVTAVMWMCLLKASARMKDLADVEALEKTKK